MFKFRSGTRGLSEKLGRRREGKMECLLCDDESESVSHVPWFDSTIRVTICKSSSIELLDIHCGNSLCFPLVPRSCQLGVVVSHPTPCEIIELPALTFMLRSFPACINCAADCRFTILEWAWVPHYRLPVFRSHSLVLRLWSRTSLSCRIFPCVIVLNSQSSAIYTLQSYSPGSWEQQLKWYSQIVHTYLLAGNITGIVLVLAESFVTLVFQTGEGNMGFLPSHPQQSRHLHCFCHLVATP